MGFKRYQVAIGIRVTLLLGSLLVVAFCIAFQKYNYLAISIPIAIFLYYFLYRYHTKRFEIIEDFFESVRYRDFSRWFNENNRQKDIRILHKGFNEVNRTIKEINSEKEAQYLYLKEILELVDTGIVAFNQNTLDILWMNHSLNKILDIPQIKNLGFVQKRKKYIYKEIFEKDHTKRNTVTIDTGTRSIQLLVSSSSFKINEVSFKIIALQNIEHALDTKESEAWRKLLSVMTHEIMNSIAPIASLSETMQDMIRKKREQISSHDILPDLEIALESIRTRSEGLMQFAKTYRSLNKSIQLSLTKIYIQDLFTSLINLLEPTLKKKEIQLITEIAHPKLDALIDRYLIEQVLINIILNAVEARTDTPDFRIHLTAKRQADDKVSIVISDNGKGISDEILESIFIPFFTTKKTGSGIGLSLSKQIMTLHRGSIQISANKPKGTTVNLLFPM
ncbi:HAMP domain-containing histidine kinase [Aquimarina sp. ERC-38]|uniref:sensor histidine kinase n=1 Tax=Aquimarina sp. ERC-38 TaxID=2949996 RepID=UPI00224813D8|nr:HAMP domain-containing sensor histidine kinase [Aquimarina sp. ERC-38]UZO81080.1 HAMP domain-containing histidine kinase [Aquimarina sp. ERC-38]